MRERESTQTYAALTIDALRNKGYLSARDLQTLNASASAESLEDMLCHLQAECLVKVISAEERETLYDFLLLIEKVVEEQVLEPATKFQLAEIYVSRRMWTHAIVELRLTSTYPTLKKESLYWLGTCFEQKGAFEKARESYERLLAVDYDYRDALERLSQLNLPQYTGVIPGVPAITTIQKHLPIVLQERYEIIRELGRGGAGIVYQAIDLKLKRDVALKVLYRQIAQRQEQVFSFLQEARLAAQLEHPNIIDIYDVNVEAQCIAMEFVSGGTLRTLLKKHTRLPLEQARSIILQICRGLQIAHDAGVLHRDIKPANIFVTKQRKIKLGDFGIAHISTIESDAFTQLSSRIGTLPYMSPEQVRGDPLTVASDIYATGVVFYEMLTGTPPFIRGDIAYHHQHSSPKPSGISEDIDAIVLQCLAKNPADRFQSARELHRTLQHQEHEERERLEKYRDLLQVALLDRDLSRNELRVLKFKRKALKISEQEARRIEQELGLTLR